MNRYFCTLFDSNYLIKGLVCLTSLKEHCPGARVFVLCMNEEAQHLLEASGLDFVTCIPLATLETPELLEAKQTRGAAEYCWTLSPSLPWYVLQTYPEVDMITYIDADLQFYSSVEPIFEEIGDNSIGIIEHRFGPRLADRVINGRFCVEWVSIRRNEEGLACLNRWREQCIEWCYYRLEHGKMGDQKYLDEWPDRYPGCHIIQHVGAGVAPWNYENYSFSAAPDGRLLIDGQPMIFYHFHQFQLLTNGKFDRLSEFYTSVCREPKEIYAAYEQAIRAALASVRRIRPGFSGGLQPALRVFSRRWAQRHLPFPVKRLIQRFRRY